MAGEVVRIDPTTRKRCRDPVTGKLQRCCGPRRLWYILAEPCYVAPGGGGPCAPAPRQPVWVCVDAILSDSGRTVRADLGATVQWGCATFVLAGWCYRVCYQPPGDDSVTTFDPPREPGSLAIVECGQTLSVVARSVASSPDPACGTSACPTGVGYIAATLCATGQQPEPPIYVCAGQVRREIVTSQFGACVCIRPGSGIDATAIPTGARVFNYVAYPEDNPGPVDLNGTILAEFRTCCQCLPGCQSAPLRLDPNNVCCCGTATLLTYATSWHVRRSQPNGDWQEITGSGTAGVPNPDGSLPVHYTFTTYRADTNQTTATSDSVNLPPPGFDCGFPYPHTLPDGTNVGGNWPPPAWCEYGPGGPTCPATYDLAGRFGWPTLLPNTPDGADALAGTLRGVANASCASFAAEMIGTTREPTTGEVYEARYNINLTYRVTVGDECRGNCVGATDGTAQLGPHSCKGCGKGPVFPVPEGIATDGGNVLA